jgi:hypothetical protein
MLLLKQGHMNGSVPSRTTTHAVQFFFLKKSTYCIESSEEHEPLAQWANFEPSPSLYAQIPKLLQKLN